MLPGARHQNLHLVIDALAQQAFEPLIAPNLSQAPVQNDSIDRILSAVRDHLGTEIAFVSRYLDGGMKQLTHVNSDLDLPMGPGFVDPREAQRGGAVDREVADFPDAGGRVEHGGVGDGLGGRGAEAEHLVGGQWVDVALQQQRDIAGLGPGELDQLVDVALVGQPGLWVLAVLGVGLARGIGALNLGVIGKIFMSWLITLPVGAALSILFFYILRGVFL